MKDDPLDRRTDAGNQKKRRLSTREEDPVTGPRKSRRLHADIRPDQPAAAEGAKDQPVKHRLPAFLQTPCIQCGQRREACCAPFTKAELDHELGGLPSRRATGPDNEMLQHLGEIGRDRLFDLVNVSWLRCEVPRPGRRLK